MSMNYDPRLREWEALASAGDASAMGRIGAHFNMQGDLDQAFEWFIKAADAGDSRAAAYVGWLFKALGDNDQAITWCRKAAQAGDLEAQTLLQSLVNPPDTTSPFAMAHTAAADRLAAEQFELGLLDQASSNWTLAANGGSVEALFGLGRWWEQQGNLGHAILFYTRASQSGHDGAMFRLGVILDGRGERDLSLGWLTKSADAGNAQARQLLAD